MYKIVDSPYNPFGAAEIVHIETGATAPVKTRAHAVLAIKALSLDEPVQEIKEAT